MNPTVQRLEDLLARVKSNRRGAPLSGKRSEAIAAEQRPPGADLENELDVQFESAQLQFDARQAEAAEPPAVTAGQRQPAAVGDAGAGLSNTADAVPVAHGDAPGSPTAETLEFRRARSAPADSPGPEAERPALGVETLEFESRSADPVSAEVDAAASLSGAGVPEGAVESDARSEMATDRPAAPSLRVEASPVEPAAELEPVSSVEEPGPRPVGSEPFAERSGAAVRTKGRLPSAEPASFGELVSLTLSLAER